ncbi:unnamed protein product [marine sediment metagenome]|uniref:Uncharacterized protein n=1 Tax=marine sediment metagenome TaxID=412755 RepID=X1H6N9_9ZZZZ
MGTEQLNQMAGGEYMVSQRGCLQVGETVPDVDDTPLLFFKGSRIFPLESLIDYVALGVRVRNSNAILAE